MAPTSYKKISAQTIWVISKYLAAKEHGFETRLFAMARHWSRSGRDVVMIGSDSNHLLPAFRLESQQYHTKIDGIDSVMLRTRRYSQTASIARVVSWIDFEWRLLRMHTDGLPRPDVIVVSSLSLLTILNGLRLRRHFGSKLVFEVRDIWPLTMVAEGDFSRWHPLVLALGLLERVAYRKADRVIGTMPNLSPHATRVAGRPVEAICIPFGFDPEAAESEERLPDQSRNIPRDSEDQLIVGYAGSMGTSNALHTVISVAKKLRGDSRFRFVFVGDGDMRPEFQRQTEDCPRVQWIGRVPRDQVGAFLRQCDLLYFAVHDSKVWESGMSLNKLTDYLMAAKPVLASYSGFPSVLNEAGCGEFIRSNDEHALEAALEKYQTLPGATRDAIGNAGRRWLLQHRTWRILAANYLEVLDRVARGE